MPDMTSPTADHSVRVAWADDAEAIAALQRQAWQTAYADLLPADALALDPDATAQAWRAAFASPGDARNRVLVALDRNRVVGYAVLSPAADPDSDPVADAEVQELTVAEGERGQGHGSRLLHAVVDTLRADRFTRAVALDGGERRRPASFPHRGRLGARLRPPRARPRRDRHDHGQADPPAHGPLVRAGPALEIWPPPGTMEGHKSRPRGRDG